MIKLLQCALEISSEAAASAGFCASLLDKDFFLLLTVLCPAFPNTEGSKIFFGGGESLNIIKITLTTKS